MKPLNEEQIKDFNDFENYKKMLRTKYYEMQKSMEMLAGTIKKPSNEADGLIGVVQSCHSSLEERWTILFIDKEGELLIKELTGEPTPIDNNAKKNNAIRSLLEKLGSFSFAAGKLMSFVNKQEDMITLQREKNMLETHIAKVIEIILQQ